MAKTIETIDGIKFVTTDNDGTPVANLTGNAGDMIQDNFVELTRRTKLTAGELTVTDDEVTPNAAINNNFSISHGDDFTLNAPINGVQGQEVTIFIANTGGSPITVTLTNITSFGSGSGDALPAGKTGFLKLKYMAEWYLIDFDCET